MSDLQCTHVCLSGCPADVDGATLGRIGRLNGESHGLVHHRCPEDGSHAGLFAPPGILKLRSEGGVDAGPPPGRPLGQYATLTAKYGRCLLALVAVYGLGAWIAAGLLSYLAAANAEPSVVRFCFSNEVATEWCHLLLTVPWGI